MPKKPTVNRWKDLADRAGWTAIQAAASAGITALTSPDLTWMTGLKFVATAAVLSVLKVVVAQNAGTSGSGDAIPGGIEK